MCVFASVQHNSFVLCFTGSHISSQDPSAMEKSELSVSPVNKVMAKINGKDLGQILIKRNNCWYKWCFQCIDIARAEELSVEEHWSMYLTFASSFIFCETSLKGLSLLSSASCSPARWTEVLQGCSFIWSSSFTAALCLKTRRIKDPIKINNGSPASALWKSMHFQ